MDARHGVLGGLGQPDRRGAVGPVAAERSTFPGRLVGNLAFTLNDDGIVLAKDVGTQVVQPGPPLGLEPRFVEPQLGEGRRHERGLSSASLQPIARLVHG